MHVAEGEKGMRLDDVAVIYQLKDIFQCSIASEMRVPFTVNADARVFE
jgi:hypothetical protein